MSTHKWTKCILPRASVLLIFHFKYNICDLITFLMKAIYKIQYLIGVLITVLEGKSVTIMAGNMVADRQAGNS